MECKDVELGEDKRLLLDMDDMRVKLGTAADVALRRLFNGTLCRVDSAVADRDRGGKDGEAVLLDGRDASGLDELL